MIIKNILINPNKRIVDALNLIEINKNTKTFLENKKQHEKNNQRPSPHVF